MTLRKSPVVILSEAKNLNSLRTHRELLAGVGFGPTKSWKLSETVRELDPISKRFKTNSDTEKRFGKERILG